MLVKEFSDHLKISFSFVFGHLTLSIVLRDIIIFFQHDEQGI